MASLDELLENASPGELELLRAFQQQLPAGTPQAGSFDLPELGGFKEEAEGLVGEFFDKDLDLLNKEIKTIKRQAEERTEIGERRIGEEEESFFNIEDVSFARALESAQQGFSGRGTFTSGFRRGAATEQRQQREFGLERAERGFAEGRETLDVDLRQLLERQDIAKERGELKIERGRETATLARQEQLQGEELLRLQSQKTQRENILRANLAA